MKSKNQLFLNDAIKTTKANKQTKSEVKCGKSIHTPESKLKEIK
jgi:hypothetical protein